MYISTREMVISIICNACGVLGLILWAIEAHKSNASQRIQSVKSVQNSSEKPNNCEDAENPSGDVWECGCFLDTYCEHQIYDRNPDGTINIVECGYEPKDKSQTDCETCKYGQDKHRYAHICNECGVGINNYTPQNERSK